MFSMMSSNACNLSEAPQGPPQNNGSQNGENFSNVAPENSGQFLTVEEQIENLQREASAMEQRLLAPQGYPPRETPQEIWSEIQLR